MSECKATQQSLGAIKDGPLLDAEWKCRVCKKLPGEHPNEASTGPRSFWIRHWVGQDIACKQFAIPEDYDDFRKLLMRAFSFPFAGKVYYFPSDNILNLAHRVLVNNAAAFEVFLSIPRKAQPLLYLWKRDQVDSPDLVPADQESKSEVAEDASDTSRGSVQTVWSIGVKNLDEWKCVVCATNHRSTLIGAHVVPRTANPEELRAVRLPTAYEARNGMTMCANCSGLYDTGFFFFERDGTIHISDALTSTPEWAARAGTKINRTVQRTEENWPTDPIIEFRKAYYLERQKRRHQDDDLPFHCAKCDKGYKQAKSCSKHEKGCTGTHLKTPAKEEGKKA
jgi:hypothetical protein